MSYEHMKKEWSKTEKGFCREYERMLRSVNCYTPLAWNKAVLPINPYPAETEGDYHCTGRPICTSGQSDLGS